MIKKLSIALTLCALICFFTGCVGTNNSRKITARSTFGNDYLEIEISVQNYSLGGNLCHFSSENDVKEMERVFKSVSSNKFTLDTEIFDENLFIQKNIVNTDICFYYYLIAGETKNSDNLKRYTFLSAEHSVCDESGENPILVPFHLFKDLALPYHTSSGDSIMKAAEPYELSGDKQAFINFYKNCFIYDVTESENLLTINVNRDLLQKSTHTKKDFKIFLNEQEPNVTVIYQMNG